MKGKIMSLVSFHNKSLSNGSDIKGRPYSHGDKVMSALCDLTHDMQPGKRTLRTLASMKNNKTSLSQPLLIYPQDPASPAGVS